MMQEVSQQLILALSTSTGVAQVVLAKFNLPTGQMQVLDAWAIEVYAEQSLTLLPSIQAALNRVAAQHIVGTVPKQPNLIAIDVGPGGFTSIRTACAIGQALGLAWQVPVMPVGAFEAQCWAYVQQHCAPGSVAGFDMSSWDVQSVGTFSCWIDARMNEWYHAKLSFSQMRFMMLTEPALVNHDDCLDVLKAGAPLHQHSDLPDTVLIHQGLQATVVVDGALPRDHVKALSPSALGVALAASNALFNHADLVFSPVLPQYVRNKVAQTTAERLGLS